MTPVTGTSGINPGQLFAGRYLIKSLLGKGGMGQVFLAEDTVLAGEQVALKVLYPELSCDANLAARFIREVQLTRKVTHPNVVRTYDVGRADDLLYYTMEHLEGSTLKDCLHDGPLDISLALDYLSQICDGLEAIHSLDIVHRDLKSTNVIITPNGQAKITDFGIARPGSSELTAKEELLGSATHIAPESWRDGVTTVQTDIYALGVIAFEMVCGVLPFDGATPHELMWKHLKIPPPPPFQMNDLVPRWLDSLILRMLDKRPEHRPYSAAEVIQEIRSRLCRSTLKESQNANAGRQADGSDILYDPWTSGVIEPLEPADDWSSTPSMAQTLAYDDSHHRNTHEIHPLQALSFSASPAILNNDPETLDIGPALLSSRSEARRSRLSALGIMLWQGIKGAVVSGAICCLLVSFSWPLLSATKNTAGTLTDLIAVILSSIGTLLIVSPVFVVISAPLASFVGGLRQGLRVWLGAGISMVCLGILYGTCHVIRVWTSSKSISESDIFRLSGDISQATLKGICELAFFEPVNTFFRIVPFQRSVALAAGAPQGLSQVIWHTVAMALFTAVMFILIAKIVCRVNRRLPLLTALAVTVTIALSWVTRSSLRIDQANGSFMKLELGFLSHAFSWIDLAQVAMHWGVLFLIAVAARSFLAENKSGLDKP